jgi:putative transcriptional regulator
LVNKIKEYRKNRGYNIKEFAQKVGISESHLRKIERGVGSPSLKVAVRIAKELKCKLDDLFF